MSGCPNTATHQGADGTLYCGDCAAVAKRYGETIRLQAKPGAELCQTPCTVSLGIYSTEPIVTHFWENPSHITERADDSSWSDANVLTLIETDDHEIVLVDDEPEEGHVRE